jgi:acetyl esterase/lipase
VIVCPGGGYGALAKDHEGDQIARWLNSLGIQAFVLQYRIAPRYHYPAPLLDAQRAIRFVRAHAADYRIAPAASASGDSRPAATWPPPPARTSMPATPRRPIPSIAPVPARIS